MGTSAGNGSYPGNRYPYSLARFTNAEEIQREQFFGVEVIELAGTSYWSWTLSGILSTTAWSYDASGFTLNSGSTDRYVVATLPPETGAYSVKLALQARADQVCVFLRGGEDGRNCYQAGVFDTGASVFKAQIRLVTDGVVAGSAVTNAAGDTPASAACESDVSTLVPTGTAYTLEVRLSGGFIELRINGETTARLKHAPLLLAGQVAVGFASAVDGARVLSASVATLTGVVSGAEDILVVVCDGDVWATVNGVPTKVQENTFPATGFVQMEAANSVMLMLGPLEGDIARARIYDPVTQTVSAWVPTAGTLPGQTTDGTTHAQRIGAHGTRIVLARWKGDEQNAGFSAVYDGSDTGGYLNFDYGSNLVGNAFTLASTRPLKLGQPITAIQTVGASQTIFPCDHCIEAFIGDPALGQVDTGVIAENEGGSGFQSIMLATEGRVIAHGPAGLVIISPPNSLTKLSESVLVQGLKYTDEELLELSVLLNRDPNRSWTFICFSPNDGSLGTYFIYDEVIGGFSPGRPGYFPIQFPAEAQPSCSTIWMGKMVFGTRDGYVRNFDEASNDDEGTTVEYPIDARFVCELIASQNLAQNASVGYFVLEMTPDSSPVDLVVYGARTPAIAYSSTRRTLLKKTIKPRRHEPIGLEVSSPALLIELRNARAGENFAIEGLQGQVRTSADPREGG